MPNLDTQTVLVRPAGNARLPPAQHWEVTQASTPQKAHNPGEDCTCLSRIQLILSDLGIMFDVTSLPSNYAASNRLLVIVVKYFL